MRAKLINEHIETSVEMSKLNIDMIKRELNILENYAINIKENPEHGNITSFADTVMEFIEDIKEYLN